MFQVITQKILACRRAQKTILAMLVVAIVLGGIFMPLHQAHAFGFLVWLGGASVISGILAALLPDTVGAIAITAATWILSLVAYIANLLMIAAGNLLDYVLEFSIREGLLNEIGAIQIGWEVVRDLSNIFFIFILLFIAIATILQIEKYGTKALLAQVIIVALLINFSLFITKVVIDASNIFALQFYDSLTASGGSISATILNGLNLIQVYNTEELESLEDKIRMASIFFFLTALYLTTAWAFLMGALLFIGRLIAFIFLMVLAPAAFLLSILPNTRQYYVQWWKLLISQAVVAPLYLFVLFIVIRITQEDGFLQPINQGDIFDVSLIFNFVIVIGLLLYGLKIVKQISGEFGARSIDFGKKATGFLAGTLIAGGGGALARATVGRSARWFTQRGGLQQAAKGGGFGGWAARRALPVADYTSKAGFDVRGIKPVREGARKLGIGLGKPTGRGGYEAIRRKEVEKITKRAEVFKEPEARRRYAEDIERGGIIAGRLPGELGEGRTIFSTMAGTTGARLEAAEKISRPSRRNVLGSEREQIEARVEELSKEFQEVTKGGLEEVPKEELDALRKSIEQLTSTLLKQGVPQERVASRVNQTLNPRERMIAEGLQLSSKLSYIKGALENIKKRDKAEARMKEKKREKLAEDLLRKLGEKTKGIEKKTEEKSPDSDS